MTTLADDLAAYIRHGRTTGWMPRTIEGYENIARQAVLGCRRRGCTRAADVTPADLEAILTDLSDRGRSRRHLIKVATLLKAAFAWLHDHGRLLTNPARSLPLPDDGDEVLPPPPLSEAEVQAIFAALPRGSVCDLRNAALLELLYGCGLRRAEVCALNLDDIDLSRRTLRVLDGKCGQDRLLPLMSTAVAAVQDYLALRRTLVKGPDRGALLLSMRGHRITTYTVHGFFTRLNATRGPEAPHLHPHLFRHSIAVHLLRGGADIRHIQAFLGHGDLDTTKIYLRMVPGRLKEDYDKAMPDIAVGLTKEG